MDKLHFIKSPLINANEETATLIQWSVISGSYIHQGEIVCAMETTKSTFEIQADVAGYIHFLVNPGEQVNVNQPIAVISQTPEKPQIILEVSNPESQSHPDSEITWTKKAKLIAQKHHLNPEQVESILPTQSKQVNEEFILNYINQSKQTSQPIASSSITTGHGIERILILGGGNIAVLVLDILDRIPGKQAVAILDDNPTTHGSTIFGCPIQGNLDLCLQLWEQKTFDYAALAIGQMSTRQKLYEKFTSLGIPFTNIIDPTASILTGVRMGNSNMIMGFCRIGPECEIGNNNFLSAYINIEHHNHLGNHCTFGPGVVTSGGVNIGNNVQFGTGIFIEPRLTIGDFSTIASGVILTTHVPANSIVKTKTNFAIQPKR